MKPKNRRKVLLHKKPRCHYCHIPLVEWYGKGTPPRMTTHTGHAYATIDHCKPKARGGIDSKHNTVLCCSCCNAEKGSRFSYAEFMAYKTNERIARAS